MIEGASGPIDPADRLEALLLALDDALADGRAPGPIGEVAGLDPEAKDRLDGALGLLLSLHRRWPWPGATVAGGDVTLGRYRIRRLLGRGGHGVVFLAHDPDLKRDVALKVPRPGAFASAETRRRFLREARALARLDHPGIVPIFELGEEGRVCYLAARYVDGPNLAAWLDGHDGPVEPRAAAALVLDLAGAVAHAHARGVIHRDLKPSNILLEPADDPGGRPRPRIADFGLARLLDETGDETRDGSILGTPRYRAPEQAGASADRAGPAADVYALGAILDEILDTNANVPADLRAIASSCLRADPADRYAGALELADDLARYLDRTPIVGPKRRRLRRLIGARTRGLLPAGLAVAAVVGLATARRPEVPDAANSGRDARPVEERRARYHADLGAAARRVADHELQEAEAILAPWASADDLHGFAWGLVRSRLHRETTTIRHPTGEIYHARFSADGRTIATAGQDGTARIWDVVTFAPRLVLTHGAEVNWIDLGSDGRVAATAGDDGALRLWDLPGGTPRGRPLVGHAGPAVAVVLTDDGRHAASGGRDRTVRLWDLDAARAIAAIPMEGEVETLAHAPGTGAFAVGCKATGWADLLDERLRPLRRLANLRLPPHDLYGVALSRDGRWAAATSGEHRAALWSTADGVLRAELIGHRGGTVFSLAFSPDGDRLATAGDDGLVRLWRVPEGTPLDVLHGHEGRIWCVAFAPDGRRLVTAGRDGTARVWDLDAPPERQVAPLPVARCRPSALTPSDDGRSWIVVQPLGADQALPAPPADAPFRLLTLSSDGAFGPPALSSAGHGLAFISDEQTLILGAPNGTGPAVRVVGRAFGPEGPAISPDGQLVAVVDAGAIRLFDASTGREVGRRAIGGDFHAFLAFSPDGRRLAAQAVLETLVWNLPDGALHRVARTTPGGDAAPAFSPDGRSLATLTDARTVVLLDPETLNRQAELPRQTDEIRALAFSPDGRLIATGDGAGAVRLFDARGGSEILAVDRLAGPIHLLRFAPDGHSLAACADSGPVDRPSQFVLWRNLAR